MNITRFGWLSDDRYSIGRPVLSEVTEFTTSAASPLFGRPEEFWALRHALSEGVRAAGPLIAFDLGFTRDQVIAFREAMSTELPKAFPQIEICDFGHLGDGGLHFNLVKTDGQNCAEFEAELRDWVVDRAVVDFGGSYSAEHGLGPKNLKYFRRFGTLNQDGLDRFLGQLRDGMHIASEV